MTTTEPSPAVVDRCPRCCCEDCGGLLGAHLDGGCGCPECLAYPEYACAVFRIPERIVLLGQQLGPLLSVHLGPRQQRRCMAVAHAAYHALHDYDNPKDADNG